MEVLQSLPYGIASLKEFEAVYQQSFPQGSPADLTVRYCFIAEIRKFFPQGSPTEFTIWYCFIAEI